MNEYVFNIGTAGQVKIQEDPVAHSVVSWIKGPGIEIPVGYWSYVVYDSDGNDVIVSNLKSFHLLANTDWQRLGYVYVGLNASFLLGIGGTDTAEMGSGETFTIPLLGNPDIHFVSIKVGDKYKKAVPYVNVDGVWKTAKALIMSNSEWKEVT